MLILMILAALAMGADCPAACAPKRAALDNCRIVRLTQGNVAYRACVAAVKACEGK